MAVLVLLTMHFIFVGFQASAFGMGFIDFVGGFLGGEHFINFDLMADAVGESSFDLAVNELYSFCDGDNYHLV
jgi:hypothetical protein